ncbi:MAG: Calx-beta domain-containing protein [Cyclobacteriaceae bacterium]
MLRSKYIFFTAAIIAISSCQSSPEGDNIPVPNDEHRTVSVFISPSSVVEGETANIVFRVSSKNPFDSPQLIPFEMTGSALEGEDFQLSVGMVQINPGDDIGESQVIVLEDGIDEGDETLSISIVKALPNSFALVDTTPAELTIRDKN